MWLGPSAQGGESKDEGIREAGMVLQARIRNWGFIQIIGKNKCRVGGVQFGKQTIVLWPNQLLAKPNQVWGTYKTSKVPIKQQLDTKSAIQEI